MRRSEKTSHLVSLSSSQKYSDLSYQVHQRRSKAIVRLQPLVLKQCSNIAHLVRIIALLDDGADKSGKLWLLPSARVAQFRVHKVEALERMVVLNSAIHVHATVFASLCRSRRYQYDSSMTGGNDRRGPYMALNSGLLIDNLKFVFVGGDLQFVDLYSSVQHPDWKAQAQTSNLTGTTPTTLNTAPFGFQHFEQPQAWLWATFVSSVTSTGLLEHLHCSLPPLLFGSPGLMPLSINGCNEVMMYLA